MKDKMSIQIGMGPKISWEQQHNTSLHIDFFCYRTIITQIPVEISDIKVLKVFDIIHVKHLKDNTAHRQSRQQKG